MHKTGMEAVKDVISFADLARKIGVTRGAVSQWERVPAERIAEVAHITGLPMSTIRPDLFEQSRAS
ncbi:YdaS family helix-turn-helix protein [Brucella anthropi]|uniref:YdaS family helix-turn-helix protein n=1 Tax=Brucella anthropi TaxID=529 RepID=UPI003D173A52